MNFKLTTDQVNYLNIGLMVISAVLAFRWPFETFLFAYAFFGPLHYLTEISWLHDRQYFTKRKYDAWVLWVIAAVISLLFFDIIKGIPNYFIVALTITSFVAAFIFVMVDSLPVRIFGIAAAAFLGVSVAEVPAFNSIFGVFLPTLIHVFLFTGLFILVGALRGRSFSGLLSLAVFVIVAASFFFIHPTWGDYTHNEYIRNTYGYVNANGSFTDGFMLLNYNLLTGLNLHDFGQQTGTLTDFVAGINEFLYHNPVALSVMGFIGFAYIYHYLNWFSKTSVIRWHNIPRSRFIGVIAIWLASVVLYAYNYVVGFQWLFFLSFAHVLLELPLNHITFINIGKEIGAITRLRKVPA